MLKRILSVDIKLAKHSYKDSKIDSVSIKLVVIEKY